ncbi:MAG: YbaB/EbfC family nucleoid-associated protein [Alphaproteobacteria bacterium]|nr:YbaB/EbfC family nucleoid-associated protein [Alphaproteobacteria bacterium]
MDMKALMEQAKGLQAKVAAAQESLGQTTVKGIAAGGLAIVEMSGKYDLVKLTLSPDLMKEDVDTATGIIAAAFGDAKAKADATIDKVMSAATAGMPMPN